MKKVLVVAACFVAAGAGAAWVFEGTWGSRGSGNGQFWRPLGVAVAPNGNVYVSDALLAKMQYFTSTGSYIGRWGTYGTGNGQFMWPVGVAVASNGNVYVADSEYRRGVQYFTATGSYLGRIVHSSLDTAYGIAFNPAGSPVWVSDWYGTDLLLFTPTGSFIYGFVAVELLFAGGLDVCPRGRAYVAGPGNHQVHCYIEKGFLINAWGSHGSGNGQFNNPHDIALAPNGYVFVADYGNERIQYFTTVGSFLGKWGSPGSGPGQFRGPTAIAFNADGSRLYVADDFNCRIQYFRDTTAAAAPASVGRVKALFK